MGAFIDNEGTSTHAFSHAAGFLACPRTDLVALPGPRAEIMDRAGECYGLGRSTGTGTTARCWSASGLIS